ncbi:hypothetical protein HY637_04550 [Candidatus Woesearchaeota archaeon]|nr:hypothetical protein [Candidatus Woesearchaeota archaeon]
MNLINRIRQYVGELKQAYQAGVEAQAAEDLRWSNELLQTEHPETIAAWTGIDDPVLYRELESILRREPLPLPEHSGGIKEFLFTLGQINGDRIYKVPFIKYLRKGRVH